MKSNLDFIMKKDDLISSFFFAFTVGDDFRLVKNWKLYKKNRF